MDMNRIGGPDFQSKISSASGTPQKKESKEAEPKDQVELGGKSSMPDEYGALKPRKKWLFMNYIAGDCNLKEFQCGNIDQQERIGSDPNTHIVALVDVGPEKAPMPFLKPDGTTESWSGARTLYVTKDNNEGVLNSEVVAEHGNKVDMSDPKTLKNFVIDALQKFPADNVALILNDHGGAFTGAMSDDSDGGIMSIPGMKKALAEAQEVTGKKIDIIGMDACLMANVESAYELKDVGNILMASEESEGGTGWSYDGMLGGKSISRAISRTQDNLSKKIDVTPEEFAKVVVNINDQNSGAIPTFSATYLDKMDQVKDAFDGLADSIIKTDDKDAIREAIDKSENYGGGWEPYRDLRDAVHFSNNLIDGTKDEKVKTAAEEVKKSIEEAVFANENNPAKHPESHGLTIYAPTSGKVESQYPELEFAKNSKWQEALSSIGIGSADIQEEQPRVWPDGTPKK